MSKRDTSDAKERRDEVKELLERCRSMEKELAEVKEKLAKIQKSVDEYLGRQGSSSRFSDGYSASAPRRTTPEWRAPFHRRAAAARMH